MKRILTIRVAMCDKSVIMITLVALIVAIGFVMLIGTFVTAAFANNDHFGGDPGHRHTVRPPTSYGNSSTPSDSFGGQQ
jgi:hypothetical protein